MPKKTTAKKAPKKSPTQPVAKRGEIGPQTYEQVRKVVEAKDISLLRAFDEVAKATGRKPGTIAVTYYRIAKQKAGGVTKASTAKAARSGSTDVKAIVEKITASLLELAKLYNQQEREIVDLRKQAEFADKIRAALKL